MFLSVDLRNRCLGAQEGQDRRSPDSRSTPLPTTETQIPTLSRSRKPVSVSCSDRRRYHRRPSDTSRITHVEGSGTDVAASRNGDTHRDTGMKGQNIAGASRTQLRVGRRHPGVGLPTVDVAGTKVYSRVRLLYPNPEVGYSKTPCVKLSLVFSGDTTVETPSQVKKPNLREAGTEGFPRVVGPFGACRDTHHSGSYERRKEGKTK